ncbi:MAG: hypothetical protein AAF098_19430 [Pseudomonadota bacterium]
MQQMKANTKKRSIFCAFVIAAMLGAMSLSVKTEQIRQSTSTDTEPAVRRNGVPVRMDMSFSHYWRKVSTTRTTRPAHWVTASFVLENGKCKKPYIHSSFGVPEERLIPALETAARAFENCETSGTVGGKSGQRLLLVTELMGKLGWSSVANPEAYRPMISASAAYEPERLDEMIHGCEGRCSSVFLLMTMFARANYYTALNREISANLWRYEALRAAAKNEEVERLFRNELEAHLKALYNYGAKTHQAGIVFIADQLSNDLLNRRGATAKHFRDEAIALAGRLEASHRDLELIIPLSSDSPYSSADESAMTLITHREFSVTADQGRLHDLQINCVDEDTSYSSQLKIDQESKWRLPGNRGVCKLFVFGAKGSKFRLTQYARGGLLNVQGDDI